MDGFYRGLESALLALSLALGLAVAALSSLPASPSVASEIVATTLPMISVGATGEAE